MCYKHTVFFFLVKLLISLGNVIRKCKIVMLTQCSCCFWCIGLSSAAELGGYQSVGISFCNIFPQEYKLLFEGAGSNPGDKTLEDRFFEHEVSEP